MVKGSRRFKISLFGYNRRDVITYLSTIFDETERILEDNQRLLGKIITDVESQAEQRAQLIISSAEAKAQSIIADAEAEACFVREENSVLRCYNKELLENAERALQQLKSDIYRL